MTDFVIPTITREVLKHFSSTSQECIKRLLATTRASPDLSVSRLSVEYGLRQADEVSSSSGHPPSKHGAVLILLYEQEGELRVLLTTRSKTLRTHPGQTALPGGRVDDTDASFIDTAYREAYEEVGLPLNSPDIHTVAVLEPSISLYKIVVIPVVAILTRPSLLFELKAEASEVACIFTHPLRAVLDPSIAKTENLVDIGSEDWPYEVQLYSTSDSVVPILDNMMYRMHRFRSSASPIKGLTADLLIKTAKIAFNSNPAYEQYAPGQLKTFEEISASLLNGLPLVKLTT
ncbi:hypothetical protein H0H87_001016 [Tephrocybe sp. NHM501043]|nr:hypothetical protein H0H87_001016 [Tephrocybe sp. NHM501043]